MHIRVKITRDGNNQVEVLELEEYLKGYKGVLVMVTHDRYFLDKVSNRILEISRGNMYGLSLIHI